MEKKFFKEIAIVLLPPLLNQLELNSNNNVFLDLRDIVNLNSSSTKIDEKTRENPSTLINKIARTDFSGEVIDLIKSRSEEPSFTKIMLVNYPMNKTQLENLVKNLGLAGFNISRLVVTSLASFDILATAKEENFLCPMCFRSYAKKVFLKQDRYLCPLDREDFSIYYIDKFTDYLTTYYLQNSIEVIQEFARSEKEKERRILNLNIDSGGSLAENIKKNLFGIVGKE